MNASDLDTLYLVLPRRTRTRAHLHSRERIPRVVRLLALAIRSETLIHAGVIRDYAELARLVHVSRARVSQVMGLLNLAPNLQEELLHLAAGDCMKVALREREIRAVARVIDWRAQRELWAKLRTGGNSEP